MTESTAQSIAESDRMVEVASKKLQQAEDMSNKVRTAFMASADPLGEPPVQPKHWDTVAAMLDKASSKLASCRRGLTEAKKLSESKGISLMSIAQESSVVIQDSYGQEQESKLLDFLSTE